MTRLKLVALTLLTTCPLSACGASPSRVSIANATSLPLVDCELVVAGLALAQIGTIAPRQVLEPVLDPRALGHSIGLRYRAAGVIHETGCGPLEPRGLHITISVNSDGTSSCRFEPLSSGADWRPGQLL